ncbi:Ubp5/Doa4 [Kluyveromyces lactis]|nr:Ubp5/Doa4 [Kluyveromyces lactis]
MIEHNSKLFCKSLSQLSAVASKVVAEDVEGEHFKQLLAKCIDTLSIYKSELRKLSCASKDTPPSQIYQLNETLYVYYKIVSQIASQVIPGLAEFQQIKMNSKKDSKDKELLEIYSRLVSALANDKQIGEVKRFIKNHSEEAAQDGTQHSYENGEFVSISQLHSLIRHDNDSSGILLVDIRPRMDFNDGHIKHNNVICIEPISFKESYTDSDILRKSLITASDREVDLFKNRDKFRLIVLYTDTDEHTKYYWQQLEVLQDILCNRSFDKPLHHTKVIVLQNGVNAWKEKNPMELNKIMESAISDIRTKPMEHNFHPMALSNNNNIENANSPNHSQTTSFTHYPDAPFLTNGASIKTAGLVPNQLLPSTSNLTKALQQNDEGNSEPYKLQPNGTKNHRQESNNHANGTNGTVSSNGNNSVAKSSHPSINLDFVIGLVNLGNSCYLNCIIQCLLGCHELSYIFLTNSYRKHVNVNSRLGSKGLLANYFSQLVQKMYQQGKLQTYNNTNVDSTAVHPTQFKLACGSINSLFKGKQQQDCQEFCQFLLDGLHEDLNQCGTNPPLKELSPEAEKMRETMPMRIASAIEWERYLTTDFSVIVDLFQGQYASQLRCKICAHTSTTYQAFSVLSVPVPRARSCTIYDCFKEFTKLETLEKDELWYCPYCKQRQPSTKQIVITRLPNNLIIHLKRFDNMMNKNNVFVNYPDELDLTGFWIDDYNGEMPKDNGVSLPLRGQKPPFNYKLFAVASHSGTLYGGHYTSFVDKGRVGWCSFDDVSWRKIRRKDEYITPNAYVLFYRRVNI